MKTVEELATEYSSINNKEVKCIVKDTYIQGYKAAIDVAKAWCDTLSQDIETGDLGIEKGQYFPAYDLLAHLKNTLVPRPK